MEYRLVRKGDKYAAQFKIRWMWRYGLFTTCVEGQYEYSPTTRWSTKRRACYLIEHWKEENKLEEEQRKFNRLPEIVCGPEDQCKGE